MRFTWYGKENAIIESMTPSTGTLRPDKESSKNWDDTENLYIEGDNLEVLKLLQKSYFDKVKMIYIDPPYNTGNDFIYKDNFRDNIANYKEITNQSTKANPETNGRYHTDWLNMMYPRLKLARNLLREDGVIFISIDDNEIDNIKKLCNEIFGEQNYIGSIVRRRRKSQANLSRNISVIHEYVIIYTKLNDEVLNKLNDNIDINDYKNPDNDSRGPYVTMPCTNKGGSRYSVKTSTGKIIEEEWRFKKETYYKLLEENRIVFPKNGNGKPRYKLFLQEKLKEGIIVNSWWDNISSNQEATVEIKKLFDGKLVFDTPKPVDFIKRIINLGSNEDSIVVDFFSGSSTTANAVIELNRENNSRIKYIMIQLPEIVGLNSDAYKAGYKNICEIGKERIRRAGDKIISENKDKEGIENLDIGFKVFKLEYNCGGENHSMMEEGIKVDIIKKPKDKPICKFKVYGELYYLVKTNEDVIVFPYKSGIKGKVIASIFNIELCKNKDYMQLEYLYNMKLNEFNGEDFAHSQYVTSVILDNVYKTLND